MTARIKQLLGRLTTEWEKSLFWTVTACFTIFVLVWLTGFGGDRGAAVSSKTAPAQSSLLASTALAFLEPVPALESQGDNPFALGLQKTRKQRPWAAAATEQKPPPPVKKWVMREREPTPPKKEPPPKKETPPPPEPPKPERPPASRIVEFRGVLTTTSGTPVALVTINDPLAKKSSTKYLTKGLKVDGLQIGEISRESLIVVDPKGQERKIAFGQKQKILLE